ncbi:MAG: hypothetical protein R3C58_14065 [Parvularculaceae bacterium]
MRLFALAFCAVALVAACGKKESKPAEPPAAAAEAPVSDELPGLAAPATGIAFWDHPALPFNGMMLVAGEKGVAAYNMEDGNPAGVIDGFNAKGVAVSYFGVGAQAAGFVAFLDADANTFRFYGIDNASRAFLPLKGDIAIRGAVRDFCLGRAEGAPAPALFAVEKGAARVFNLLPAQGGLSVASEKTLDAPDDAVSCAVARDGTLLVAGANGRRLSALPASERFQNPLQKRRRNRRAISPPSAGPKKAARKRS